MLTKRLTALGGLALSIILLTMGSNVESEPAAYFFPNLITFFLLGLSIILLITDGELISWLRSILNFLYRWMFGVVGQGDPTRWPDVIRLIPMFIVLFLYLYFADIIGLYVTSYLTFFLITVIYTPVRPRSRSLLKNCFIGLLFIAVIYMIFSVLLQLQTPSAWLI